MRYLINGGYDSDITDDVFDGASDVANRASDVANRVGDVANDVTNTFAQCSDYEEPKQSECKKNFYIKYAFYFCAFFALVVILYQPMFNYMTENIWESIVFVIFSIAAIILYSQLSDDYSKWLY